MKNILPYILLVLLLPKSQLWAQDTLYIKDVLTVASHDDFIIKPGTVVCFYPNARIWVEGGFIAKGTENKPIVFCSMNNSKPGTGIYVNGSNRNKGIAIAQARFENLIQPLSFEAFWARKSVLLDHLRFQGSVYNENVMMVSGPLLDYKASIQFYMHNCYFVNNSAGVIIDQAGANGFDLDLDSLVFSHNYRHGSFESLGMLHLTVASGLSPVKLKTGVLVMNENYSENEPMGLSVGGQNAEIKSTALYTTGAQRLIYDNKADNRLPLWETPLYDISAFKSANCIPGTATHVKGKIVISRIHHCQFQSLQDTFNRKLETQILVSGDSLYINYTGKNPKQVMLSENIFVLVPHLPAEIADTNAYALLKMPADMEMNIDTLKEFKTPFNKSFETGILGGLAFYVGDINHKFGIPGTYEWSAGLFFQYNHSPKWAFRSTFYKTNIGMHDPLAPIMIWQSASTYVETDKGYSQRSSWENNFVTKMTILDLDANYFFKQLPQNWKTLSNTTGYWTIALGMGMGFMHFDTYRHAFYTREKSEAELIKLRPFGTEGQNFLPDKHKYSEFTVNLNLSFQLCYTYKKIKLRYEFKSVLSMSDYLDDYGQGYTYGGNYQEWKASLGDYHLPIDPETGKQVNIESVFPAYNAKSIRTNNLLPDTYFQSHIGIAYDLGALFLNKKSK